MPQYYDINGVAEMTARESLAANIRTLMDAAGTNVLAIAKAIQAGSPDAKGPKRTTIANVVKGEVPTNIDFIEFLATHFDVKPWQLLVPDLRPHSKPALLDSAEVEDLRAAKTLAVKLMAKAEAKQPNMQELRAELVSLVLHLSRIPAAQREDDAPVLIGKPKAKKKAKARDDSTVTA
ncbi:hypothetical protein [Aquabacterium sp.]|uniref:hypothetical protein n=1 Tax=Aquabacterium sp. TaxID=1872578 RepID=UPI004037A2B3